jgi:hypothetical protein
MKEANFSDMFAKASKSVCESNIMVPPDSFSPTPSIFQLYRLHKTQRRTLNQQMEGYLNGILPLISCIAQV